ncbi:hypothetical protein F2Q69_00050649 [Brassica cretica]|uniref:Uncharacterized protein n=1 Tax=Brassica cretica TaxID=69181 RepID=A0A8S9PKE3_BRACR|nr:hypothetical protein F2Q69_00050649 [Brassica cretica]
MLKTMTDGHGLGPPCKRRRVEHEPVRDEFWQRVLNTLGQIKCNTDQMIKLLTDDGPWI